MDDLFAEGDEAKRALALKEVFLRRRVACEDRSMPLWLDPVDIDIIEGLSALPKEDERTAFLRDGRLRDMFKESRKECQTYMCEMDGRRPCIPESVCLSVLFLLEVIIDDARDACLEKAVNDLWVADYAPETELERSQMLNVFDLLQKGDVSGYLSLLRVALATTADPAHLQTGASIIGACVF